MKNLKMLFVITLMSLVTFACGGGEGGGGNSVTLSGTAAAGAPIVGIVNVKSANGGTASSPIELDGSYSIDVTGLAAPYILYAEGSVNRKSIAIYSAAIVAGTINITPITDFILRNALRGQAEDAYNDWDTVQVSEDNLNAAENDIQNQLAPLLTGIGVSSDVDLISTSFNTDQTGMDAALDVLDISYSGTTATVTNNLTGSGYTDDVTLTNDGAGLPAGDQGETQAALTDGEAIDLVWQSLAALYAVSIPSNAELTNWFDSSVADDFLEEGESKAQTLNDWLSDDGGPGVGIALSAAVMELMDVTGTSYTKGFWIRTYYADSAESGNFLTSMVFDGINWLWHGDRRCFGSGVDSHAFMYVNSTGQTTFQTGFEFDTDDEYNYAYRQGGRSAIVTGPGLPTDGVVLEHKFPENSLEIYPSGGTFYPIADDSLLSAISDNAEYTFTLCSESAADLYNGTATCTVLHEDTDTNMKPPLLNSELNASMFASLTDPTSHNAADLNFGGEINLSWTDPNNADFDFLHLTWWNSSTKYQLEADADDGGNTSATIDATGLPAPDGWAGLFIRVEDVYERDFNMGWEFL